MTGKEFWGMIMVVVSLIVANMGGLGGGGLVLPISLYFFNFDQKNSID